MTPLWIDLSDVPVGQRKTVYWGDWPLFIAHRAPEEIARARGEDEPYLGKRYLPFGEFDQDRVQKDEWVVVLGRAPLFC